MKPDWKDAPEWANWLAMDRGGVWCWHEKEPSAIPDFEWISIGKWEPAILNITWDNTLEKRPEQ